MPVERDTPMWEGSTLKRLALASIFALACGTTTVARHTVATAQYDPQKRDEVWARALGEFQARGVLVAVSDREGGVLTSQQQATEVPCDGGSCKASVAQQLTLTATGLATLRTNRTITATNRLSAPAIETQYQQETNDLLAAIAGSPAMAVLPPASPKRAPPSTPEPTNKERRTVPCQTYQDCPPGSMCSEGFCRP
jgi:hypothetical protein